MTNIKFHIAEIMRLTAIVKSHSLGGRLGECGEKYKFVFFTTLNGVGGIEVSKNKGKINALKLMIENLDLFQKGLENHE